MSIPSSASLVILPPSRRSGQPARNAFRGSGALLALTASFLAPSWAHAEPVTRIVNGDRVELGEVVPEAPELMRAIDICSSPSVGGSRLLERQVIERQVRAAGFELEGLTLPTSVRIARPGHRYTPGELNELLRAPVTQVLPAGATLLKLESTASLNLEEGVKPSPVILPKLPRRTGTVRIAFSVEFHSASGSPIRLPVTAILQLSAQVAQSAVLRGAKVALTIERGSARISADATTLSDGDVGDELRFRVMSTGKVLRGILLSPTSASVRD
jgi:hypothetical protein